MKSIYGFVIEPQGERYNNTVKVGNISSKKIKYFYTKETMIGRLYRAIALFNR